jgi:hypothetical protein
MSASEKELLEKHLKELIDTRIGPYLSFNAVNRAQIWQWCSAMGDHNPLYLDASYQASIGVQGAVAPPAMMQMWGMRDVNLEYAPGSTDDRPYPVIDYLSENGYPGNVGISYDIHFHRLLQEGDRVSQYKSVASVSDLKQTALGEGYFFTDRVEYLDQNDALFAEAFITYFQYNPSPQETSDTQSTDEATVTTPNTSIRHSDFVDVSAQQLEPGLPLPELVIPITHKLIVSGAAASQDYEDGHHNAPAAQAAAMPDIFMNILTTCGLSGRYLTDWAGPGSRLQKISFKLMAPNVPGDTMVMQGCVQSVLSANKTESTSAKVTVDFSGKNSRGFHVTGAATLALAS